MWYSEYDICYEVRHALNPYQQIRVLAELNETSVSKIEKILKQNDVPLPKYQRQSRSYTEKIERMEVTEDHLKRRQQKREYYLAHREQILARKRDYKRQRREREKADGKE